MEDKKAKKKAKKAKTDGSAESTSSAMITDGAPAAAGEFMIRPEATTPKIDTSRCSLYVELAVRRATESRVQ